ncbi:MAG: glycosyltransferase family 9 protein [Bacteroidetes bacterium]|nr:MAG: glycosyltransferase family 9 protein [Bacteroidota bacterium]
MKQILVIQTASIGDVILATALLEKLHAHDPDTRFDFLIKKGMEPLFDLHPFIRRLLVWDKSAKYRDFFRLLNEVRHERYDAVINIQRFVLTGLLTLFSGADLTIGFDKNPFSRWFSRRVPHRITPGIHEIDRNQELIAELTDATPAKPRLYPGNTKYEIRNTKLESSKSKIENRKSEIYYTVSPASLWFTKQYPAERWVALIREMPEEATVYLLGSASDCDLCERIQQEGRGSRVEGRGMNNMKSGNADRGSRIADRGSGIVNLAGELTLLESAALMQGARMNFTNDSAPMHLASAVNAPVTVIYCSTTPDFGFGPLSDDAAIVEVHEPLSCRPCGLHGLKSCPEKHFRCATEIGHPALLARL